MSEAATNKKTPIYKVLYFQVICAIVIGIVLGAVWPEVGEKMKPFGDGFIRLIKMIIAPVIFCTVVTGIAGMENMKKVGKTEQETAWTGLPVRAVFLLDKYPMGVYDANEIGNQFLENLSGKRFMIPKEGPLCGKKYMTFPGCTALHAARPWKK